MKRYRIYRAIVRWSSPALFVLLWLQLLSGLGTFKGRQLATVTLGLFDPAYAGKLHTVWLTLITGLIMYLHGTFGLQLLVQSQRIKRKRAWELGIFALGLAALVQFLWLYFG